MDKKTLQIRLSKLQLLATPHVLLEQYQLEGNLAAELLWKAFLNSDLKDKVVADLGCGNGILGAGALLLGARKVYFLDKDKKALHIAKKNSNNKGIYLLQDVQDFCKKVDTIVMNPPFGVQQRKADKPFLEKAMDVGKTIYSIHTSPSVQFIKKLSEEHNFNVEEILERKFLLKKTYSFHTHKKYFVQVGIWVLRKA